MSQNKIFIYFSILQLFIGSSTKAQDNKWPVVVYGAAAYDETTPVVNGYLIVNSRDLKGLVHRTYLKGSSFDTLLNSDTLHCRMKLYILGKDKHIDIELLKANVVSVPVAYITYIVGTSVENANKYIPLTRWKIMSPKKYLPFGRVIAQKGNVVIYDSSKKDTTDGGYLCPITMENGYEKTEIFYPFCSPKKALEKFAQKRYGVKLDLLKEDFNDMNDLLNFVIDQENILLSKKDRRTN